VYLDFFGLEREPFHITPDPEFLFPSPSHKEAFATVMYGVQQQKGFVVVTGEVGTGKTTILRSYLQKLKGSDIQPIYIFDPHLGFDELLEAILAELGGPPDTGQTQFARLQWLRHYLIDAYSNGRSVVLIIDEAQNMPVETLEQLRVLTNLETTKDKLLQVLLVGQPELEEKLGLHQLRQLNQRVAVRATLRILSTEEATDYVKHRVRQAGGTPETVFSAAALKAIVAHAKGNPRVLNITCDNVLINAFGASQSPVSAALVRDVVKTMSPQRTRKPMEMPALDLQKLLPWATAAGLVAVLGIAGMAMMRVPQGVEMATPVSAPAPASTPAPVEAAVEEAAASTPEPESADTLDVNAIALRKMLEKERAVEKVLDAPLVAPKVEKPEPVEVAEEPAPEPIVEPVAEVAAAPVEDVIEEAPAPVVETPAVLAAKPEVEEAPVAVEAVPAPVESEPAPAPKPEVAEAPKEITVAVAADASLIEPVADAAVVDADGNVALTIMPGDTLTQLLLKAKGKVDQRSIDEIKSANKLYDENLILAGETLVIPGEAIENETAAAGDAPASN
jgi:general secretion pathway protein A